MFNVSLSDRLKAAVNTLEQTGSSLQARAIGQGQGQAQSPSSTTSAPSTGQHQQQQQHQHLAQSQSQSAGQTPTSNTGPSIARSISPNPKPTTSGAEGIAVSPTRNYSTSQLAENALSGLRKSFQFGRDGTGHGRSVSGASASGSAAGRESNGNGNGDGQQELKDITSPTQVGGSSRSGSPAPASARFLSTLGGGSNFALGNDTPSVSVSATSSRPRSPNPNPMGLTNMQTAQTARIQLPTPNPNDPASYPLPLSPTTTTNPLLSPVPASAFADPLGASPSIAPQVPPDPPVLEMHAPTPENEREAEQVEGDGGGSLKIITSPSMETEVVQKVEEAAARYEEMSLKYTALTTQIEKASKVIKELTPLEGGIEDAEALEGWIRMQNGKVEMITEELKRMQDKLTLQESRMEELRDTHRLEGASQTTLVAKLRSQLSTAESNLASKAGELMQIGQLRADLTKAQTVAKEEEEKRTKAISLLKTVRMKLTKAEKDREEVERDRAEERAERSRAVEELERTKAEREREVNNLRKGFERELAGVKERSERELQAKKAAWELEMITTKASHAKELSSRMTQVSGLEAIVKELNISKQKQFETLESRQTEVETSRAEMERMQNSTKELEYQLREANERCSLLEDQLQAQSSSGGRGRLNVVASSRAGTPSPSPSRQNSNTSAGIDVQRLLAEAESRAESKMSDLRHKIRSLEMERNEVEEEWGNKLQERVRELDKLRRDIRERSEEYEYLVGKGKEKDEKVEEAEEKCRVLERELNALKIKMQEAEGDHAASADAERIAKEEINDLQSQISTLNTQLDDFRNLTTQLRQTNRTLREEMRKIQSSVQLMERSRNPGVGYWSAGTSASTSNGHPTTGGGGVVPPPSRSGITSPDSISMVSTPTKESRRSLESFDTPAAAAAGQGGRGSPAPSTTTATTNDSRSGSKTAPANEEEEVNLEYLRNVILQFLENKEMRPNLVRVLSVILRFTPQELRRLNAKLLT